MYLCMMLKIHLYLIFEEPITNGVVAINIQMTKCSHKYNYQIENTDHDVIAYICAWQIKASLSKK